MKTYDIVGNPYYVITDDKKVLRKDGNPSNLIENEKTVTIAIYGYIKEVEKEWLYWLSSFRIQMPVGYEYYIFNIYFKNNYMLKHMKKDAVIVLFKEPVEIIHGNVVYRLLPRFPEYAVSKDGSVLNIKRKTVTRPKVLNHVGHYKTSAVVDQANLYTYDRQMTHRLVASVWIKNPDWDKYYLVDHIDGNKQNCNAANLRWTDHVGNNQATVDQGLRVDTVPVIIRDIDTGEVTMHGSLTLAGKHMGRSQINTKADSLATKKVWTGKNGRYEIKYVTDTTPWYYLDKENAPTTNQKVEVTIITEVGEVITIRKLEDFTTKVFNGLKKASSIKDCISIYKKYHPNDKVTLTILDNYSSEQNYIAKNLMTDEIITSMSRKELSERTNVAKSSMQKSIANDGAYQFNNWVFKVDNHTAFATVLNLNTSNQPKKIICLNKITNEETTYDSLRQAAVMHNVDKNTILKLIASQTLFRNTFLFIDASPLY